MTTVLVLGDSHVDDEQDLRRFGALGQMIVDRRPDAILSIGDFMSFNCLSAWDRDKRKAMEGKRYAKEIAAGNRALDLMEGPLRGLQWRQRKNKEKLYSPDLIFIEGNHEDRLTRYLAIDPTFADHVSCQKDLKLEERGWKWVPFKQDHVIDGVSFTHIPHNGIRAIGEPNVAQKALKLYHGSVVFGHTHTLSHAAEHKHGAPHLNQALSVGCFFDHVDDYAVGHLNSYWRGLIVLDIYSENRYDIETISMRKVKEYG